MWARWRAKWQCYDASDVCAVRVCVSFPLSCQKSLLKPVLGFFAVVRITSCDLWIQSWLTMGLCWAIHQLEIGNRLIYLASFALFIRTYAGPAVINPSSQIQNPQSSSCFLCPTPTACLHFYASRWAANTADRNLSPCEWWCPLTHPPYYTVRRKLLFLSLFREKKEIAVVLKKIPTYGYSQ